VSRLDGIGDANLRRTLLHVRGRADPPTAAEVAAETGVATSVARWRLERLVETGSLVPLLRRQAKRGPGSGRPAKTYAVTPELEQVEFPRRRLERLVRLLAGALPRRGRGRRLDEIGRSFGVDLADEFALERRAKAPLEQLAAALRRDGFHVVVEAESGAGATLVTATCPLRPLIALDPSLRELDQGMWRGLVERSLAPGDAADVVCETHGCLDEGSCRITVALRR
jgi:predicted ArsR family transcriptional regulator